MTTALSVQSCLSFGWKTFKARPWLFVGSSLIYAAIQLVLGWAEAVLPGFIGTILNVAVGTLLALGLMTLYLKAHDSLSGASFKDMWNPKPFWKYLVTSFVIGALVFAGIILLIVPGVILGLAFSFAPYIVIEKKVWTMAALKESWRLTKGQWWKLFLLGLVIALMNIIGAFLLLVGLLVTAPISVLAMVHAYRTLAGASAGSMPAAAEPVPAPAVPESASVA